MAEEDSERGISRRDFLRVASGVTLGALVASGCEDYSAYTRGTVLKESGTIVDSQKAIERSEGALFGNDSVRVSEPTYAIQFRADHDNKVYTVSVTGSPSRLEALSLAIEQGTKIRIKRYLLNRFKGVVGQVSYSNLEVLGNSEPAPSQ